MSSQVTSQDGSQTFKSFFADDAGAMQRMGGALQAGARSVAVHRPGASIIIKGRGFIFQNNGKWRDSTTGEFVDDPYVQMQSA